jgi:pyrimidine-specific ribonucleoside hydrolase
MKKQIMFDMETSDPDDFLTLILLLGHPDVELQAVTITPGTRKQISLVRQALEWFNKDIPIGSFNIDHPKECVSDWHYKAFNLKENASDKAENGGELLAKLCNENTILVTGAALKNLGHALELGLKLGTWVAQGGFAGDNVVPENLRLEKFKGKITCPTFNLNGDPKSALNAIASQSIENKFFVSKNVCHGVIYNHGMHEKFASVKDKSLSLNLIYKGMDYYLSKHSGKAFHDPLAACCAIDRSIGVWKNVDLYREKGEWGSRLNDESNVKIIIDYDKEKFVEVLTKY